MSIFKRKKSDVSQSGPKVFTPEDYSKLMNQQDAPPAATTSAPEATPSPAAEEPASPSFDSISPTAMTADAAPSAEAADVPVETPTPGGADPQLTEEHPEKILPISVHHNGNVPNAEALESALEETAPAAPKKSRRTSPFDEEPGGAVASDSPAPAAAPEANAVSEPPAMPRIDEALQRPATPSDDEFQGNVVPPLDQPAAAAPETAPEPVTEAAPEPAPAVEPVAEAASEPTPASEAVPEIEAEPVVAAAPEEPATPTAPQMSPADVQELAKRVSQALVDLEELRQQKEELEQSLQELQAKHAELESKIEQQRKIATDLLDQVHRAV